MLVAQSKLIAAASAGVFSAGALLNQGSHLLGAGPIVTPGNVESVPDQLAWVIGGIISLLGAVVAVLMTYRTVTKEMDERAKVQAQGLLTVHEQGEGAKTKTTVGELLTSALEKHSTAQTAALEKVAAAQAEALRAHIASEEKHLDVITEKLQIGNEQNRLIIATLATLGNSSAPGAKKSRSKADLDSK